MIKNIFSFSFLLLILFSCGTDGSEGVSDAENDLEDNFAIKGKVEGGEHLNFYLEAISQQGNISVAQTKSDGSGNFELVGNIPGFGMYQLRMGESNDKIIPVTLVPGDDIKLDATFANYAMTPNLSGAKWTKVMTKYMAVFSKFHEDQSELMKQQGKISDEELTEKFLALKKPVDAFAIGKMNEDPANPFNVVLSSSASPSMGFEYWDPQNLDVLKKVAAAYKKSYPDSPLSETLANQVYQIEIAHNQYLMNNSGQQMAPEIALNNPEGIEIKLSSLRGKYVLIDFWASWCGPCRKESPNVVRMYKKYKDQGFTVYSVSLDSSVDAWKGAIASDGLIWPNHVSDLMKWNSPLPQLYGFEGIPYTVLINKEGKIIGTGLRGTSLEQKLKEIFENS